MHAPTDPTALTTASRSTPTKPDPTVTDLLHMATRLMAQAHRRLAHTDGPADTSQARDIVAALAPLTEHSEDLVNEVSTWAQRTHLHSPTRPTGPARFTVPDMTSMALQCLTRDLRDITGAMTTTSEFLGRLDDTPSTEGRAA